MEASFSPQWRITAAATALLSAGSWRGSFLAATPNSTPGSPPRIRLMEDTGLRLQLRNFSTQTLICTSGTSTACTRPTTMSFLSLPPSARWGTNSASSACLSWTCRITNSWPALKKTGSWFTTMRRMSSWKWFTLTQSVSPSAQWQKSPATNSWVCPLPMPRKIQAARHVTSVWDANFHRHLP